MTKWEYARLESSDSGVSVVFSHQAAWTGMAPEAFFESESRAGGPTLQRMRLRMDTDRWLVFKRPQPAAPEGKAPQTDIVRDLVQRQLLRGKLPLP